MRYPFCNRGQRFPKGEIVVKAGTLREKHNIHGALEELKEACEDFASGRFKCLDMSL